jgi:putative ABC transport system ATP-binding protein
VVGVPTGRSRVRGTALPGLGKNDLFCHLSFVICHLLFHSSLGENDAVIELTAVTRIYRQGDSPVVALDSVNLKIAAGEFVAITGESGSGKSTLLHLMGGLDKPDRGEILVDGWSLVSATEQQLTQYRRHRLGIVFQFFNLLPTLNVIENVCLPLRLQRVREKESRRRATEMLELVGMSHREKHFVHQLSGGEMQRTAIARALVHRPQLLLADEPTGNLDSDNAGRLLEVFRTIAEHRMTTLVVATHSPDVAAIAHRHVRVGNGKIEIDSAADAAESISNSR